MLDDLLPVIFTSFAAKISCSLVTPKLEDHIRSAELASLFSPQVIGEKQLASGSPSILSRLRREVVRARPVKISISSDTNKSRRPTYQPTTFVQSREFLTTETTLYTTNSRLSLLQRGRRGAPHLRPQDISRIRIYKQRQGTQGSRGITTVRNLDRQKPLAASVLRRFTCVALPISSASGRTQCPELLIYSISFLRLINNRTKLPHSFS